MITEKPCKKKKVWKSIKKFQIFAVTSFFLAYIYIEEGSAAFLLYDEHQLHPIFLTVYENVMENK